MSIADIAKQSLPPQACLDRSLPMSRQLPLSLAAGTLAAVPPFWIVKGTFCQRILKRSTLADTLV